MTRKGEADERERERDERERQIPQMVVTQREREARESEKKLWFGKNFGK
jgi:hypothetical protein